MHTVFATRILHVFHALTFDTDVLLFIAVLDPQPYMLFRCAKLFHCRRYTLKSWAPTGPSASNCPRPRVHSSAAAMTGSHCTVTQVTWARLWPSSSGMRAAPLARPGGAWTGWRLRTGSRPPGEVHVVQIGWKLFSCAL